MELQLKQYDPDAFQSYAVKCAIFFRVVNLIQVLDAILLEVLGNDFFDLLQSDTGFELRVWYVAYREEGELPEILLLDLLQRLSDLA